MDINIREIVDNKIKDMEESKVLENLIEETVEKAVSSAITSAINGYSVKRIIEEKIEKEVKDGVADIGFTAYNTFVVNKIRELLNNVAKNDITDKFSKALEDLIINKKESINLSEIVEKYREVYEGLDPYEMEDLDLDDGHFSVSWDESESGSFRHLRLTLSPKEQQSSSLYGFNDSNKKKLELRLCSYKSEAASISKVKYEGEDLKDIAKINHLSDIEILLANLFFNETKVIIDIDEDDIETYIGNDD